MMTAHQGARPNPMAIAAVATASPATAIRPSQNRLASRTASVIQFVRQAYFAQRRNQFVEMVDEHIPAQFIGGTIRKAESDSEHRHGRCPCGEHTPQRVPDKGDPAASRSEQTPVGKEWMSQGKSEWWPQH